MGVRAGRCRVLVTVGMGVDVGVDMGGVDEGVVEGAGVGRSISASITEVPAHQVTLGRGSPEEEMDLLGD